MNKVFSETTLKRLREIPSKDVLTALSDHVKTDPTFIPIKNAASRRWHVKTVRGEFELITTHAKWYDTRARKGGGGAVDLVMHLMGLTFVDAAKLLSGKLNVLESHNTDGGPPSGTAGPGGRA